MSAGRPRSRGAVAPVPLLTAPLERMVFENRDWRRVLWTTERAQLVLMSLPPGAALPQERHAGSDQFLHIESGMAEGTVDGRRVPLTGGGALHVPAGGWHGLRNTSTRNPLQLYTLYTPPVHPRGLVHPTQPVDPDRT